MHIHIDAAYIATCHTLSSLSVLVTRMCSAKTTEPIEMPFVGLTHVDPRNRVLDGVKQGLK